jgi:hypothetical protein
MWQYIRWLTDECMVGPRRISNFYSAAPTPSPHPCRKQFSLALIRRRCRPALALSPHQTSEDHQTPLRTVSARSAPPPSVLSAFPRRTPSTPRPRADRLIVFTAPSPSALNATPPSRSTTVRRRPVPQHPRHRVGPLRSGSPGPRRRRADPHNVFIVCYSA